MPKKRSSRYSSQINAFLQSKVLFLFYIKFLFLFYTNIKDAWHVCNFDFPIKKKCIAIPLHNSLGTIITLAKIYYLVLCIIGLLYLGVLGKNNIGDIN